MSASALRERAPEDGQATLEILNRMWGAAPPPGTALQSAESTTDGAAEGRRGRGARRHLRLVTAAADPAPEIPAPVPPTIAPAPDSFFAKRPAPPIQARATLPVPAMALGMPRLARWLRTGAMVYAGSMTAALIVGTALWPR